jgi:hypothetical protein
LVDVLKQIITNEKSPRKWNHFLGDFYLIVPNVYLSKTILEAQLIELSIVDC